MRIIAGEARGRGLIAPPGEGTRPTSDKLRGALFNILYGRAEDSCVLDLFGGTGALALEAISRGAESAVIVDTDRNAIRAIERNACAVAGERYADRIRIIRGDYKTVIPGLTGRKFDLVFLDPPYRMLEAYADALTRLRTAGCIAEDAVFVLERAKDAEITLPAGFVCFDARVYGETAVDFVREGVADL